MLHLVTGTPGTGKTAFVVATLDKIEKNNKVNIVKNKQFFLKNKEIINKNNLQNDFSYIEYETGSGHTLQRKIKILDDDYFDIFSKDDYDDLRPDDYFRKSVEYNTILERVAERDNIKSLTALLAVRTIYSNINALKIDYVRNLVYDWRTCADGSIFAIDEVQLVEPYNNLKDRNNDIVQDLTIHRHRGFDFYFLTQAPVLLHSTIKVLIGVHYHLTKPYGFRTRVYQWGSTRDYPNTMINKINCERKFDFSPPNYIYKLYKSTTINTHHKRLPYKMLFFLTIFIFICLYILVANIKDTKKSTLVAETVVQSKKSSVASVASTTAKIEKTEVIQSKQSSAVSATVVASVASTAKTEVIQNKQASAVSATVVDTTVANVIVFSDKCSAYNISGEKLHISHIDCMKYAKKSSINIKQTLKNSSFLEN